MTHSALFLLGHNQTELVDALCPEAERFPDVCAWFSSIPSKAVFDAALASDVAAVTAYGQVWLGQPANLSYDEFYSFLLEALESRIRDVFAST